MSAKVGLCFSHAAASLRVAGPSRFRSLPSFAPTVRPLSSTSARLSGHNRWSKIRHKKGAADLAKSINNSRACAAIATCLRPPNSHDPSINQRLAIALAKAKAIGVTKAGIEAVFERARSIMEGKGKELVYEALGPGGKDAYIIQCVTDNGNRTVQELNKVMDKFKVRFAPVSYLFERKGLITIEAGKNGKTFDELFDVALEGGAEDVKEVEGEEGPEWEIYTDPTELNAVSTVFSSPPHDVDFPVVSSELAYIPVETLTVSNDGGDITEERAETIGRMTELLEAEPSVVKVWTNIE